MSYATAPANVIGEFYHRETGCFFEFALPAADEFRPFPDAPHKVAVLGGWRWATVLKTVAHVIVDEDADGQPVIERWPLKRQRTF